MSPSRRAPAQRVTVPLLALVLLAVAAGCGGVGGAGDNRPTVVTSIYPLTWLARQITGGHAQVHSLAGSGADPHHLEVTPRQVIDLQRAELTVYIRGLQPAMDDAIAQQGTDAALDVTSVVDVLPAGNAHDGTASGRSENGVHSGDGGQPGGTGAHGAYDPHLWLDPLRFATVAQKLGDRIASVDPAHARAYEKRTGETVDRLRALHDAYTSGLRGCDSRVIVTSHSSFSYLAHRYDLHQVGIAGLGPDVEASPRRIAEVARIAAARNVGVIFHDQSGSAELATVVASETGARTAALDTVTQPPADGSGGYLAAMRANLQTLRSALGCS